MKNLKRKENIQKEFEKEFEKVYDALKFENYRNIESIIDKVNNNEFTRYCVTLLIDELISFETQQFCQEDD